MNEYGSDFKKGDIIEFCGDQYIVEENHGNSGVVQEYPAQDGKIRFYWTFQGERCTLVKKHDG